MLNSDGEIRHITCPKCCGCKKSIYPEKTKEGNCTICKGKGKVKVFCYIGNDYWSGS